MLVIKVNDFSIPSDENDYDELVAFADTMASIEQFEAIPKAEYEAKLKTNMVTILEELQLEIEKMDSREHECDFATQWCIDRDVVVEIIQEKINALKGDK